MSAFEPAITQNSLIDGIATVFGEDRARRVTEAPHQAKRSWAEIQQICDTALQDGRSFIEIEPGNLLWGARAELGDEVLAEVVETATMFPRSQFGSSQGLMAMHDGMNAPPSAWLVSSEARFAVLEEDLMIYRVVSYDAFAADRGQGRTISILDQDWPILVTSGGRTYDFSRRFVYDVVFGFETVQSCIDGLFGFADELERAPELELGSRASAKPQVWTVTSKDEALQLASRGDIDRGDLVAVPADLLAELVGAEIAASITDNPAVLVVGEFKDHVPKTGASE